MTVEETKKLAEKLKKSLQKEEYKCGIIPIIVYYYDVDGKEKPFETLAIDFEDMAFPVCVKKKKGSGFRYLKDVNSFKEYYDLEKRVKKYN